MRNYSDAQSQKIVAAARDLLIQHGYDGTTVAKVAKRARSALGSVTHFYPTKAALVVAVAEDTMAAVVAKAETALQAHDADVERAVFVARNS